MKLPNFTQHLLKIHLFDSSAERWPLPFNGQSKSEKETHRVHLFFVGKTESYKYIVKDNHLEHILEKKQARFLLLMF